MLLVDGIWAYTAEPTEPRPLSLARRLPSCCGRPTHRVRLLALDERTQTRDRAADDERVDLARAFAGVDRLASATNDVTRSSSKDDS